jgi:predicted LPLAT superfamily acyltransferase
MFGEIMLDKFLAWMGQITLEDIRFETDGFFEQAMQAQQGGIILISHLGNTEVCNALAHKQPGLKLTLLVYTQHAEKFNALIKKVGNQAQIEMYQVTEMTPAFAMLMADRVQAGEYLVIAGDRTPVTGDQRVSYVNFFGRPAAMPQGGFILAGLLKCPVFLMFCLKHNDGYHIYLERFAKGLSWQRRERQEKLQQVVQEYAERLQHYCLKTPLQWFNFYPFWAKSEEFVSQKTRSLSGDTSRNAD